MNPDESVLIRKLEQLTNDFLISTNFEEAPDLVEIENRVVEDLSILPDGLLEQINLSVSKTDRSRKRHEQSVRHDISIDWANALGSLDLCIAFADYLQSKLTNLVFSPAFEVLENKTPRRREGAVTGALLKCLLLLSLHSRACVIASEVSLLTKSGFLDGAEARLRGLYEHLVVITLIRQDKTYEIAERYQDYGCLISCKEARARLESLADGSWGSQSEDMERKGREVVADLEMLVQRAIERWGPEIKSQYGWAHPIFPPEKKRIYFQDLERVAGSSMFRSDYLRENEHVHASSGAAIKHTDFGDFRNKNVNFTRSRRQDDRISFVGERAVVWIHYASREAAKGISWETEEYDEFMSYFPMDAEAIRASRCFSHRD